MFIEPPSGILGREKKGKINTGKKGEYFAEKIAS